MNTKIQMPTPRTADSNGKLGLSQQEMQAGLATEPCPPTSLRLSVPVNEACQALGIGRTSLYDLISSKKLKSAVVAGRRVIPVSELERLLANCMQR